MSAFPAKDRALSRPWRCRRGWAVDVRVSDAVDRASAAVALPAQVETQRKGDFSGNTCAIVAKRLGGPQLRMSKWPVRCVLVLRSIVSCMYCE